MAQRQTVTYVSDLSGKEIVNNDAPTLSFGWGGDEYNIDLTSDEAEKFYKVLSPYLDAATKVSKAKRGTAKKSVQSGPTAADIRAWAQQNGHAVPERGRIPAEVREAFDAAN